LIIERLTLCSNATEANGSAPSRKNICAGWPRTPSWAPHYVIHKTLLGLREAYLFSGNETALELAKNFVAWLRRWFGSLDQATREQVLDVETGGMLEEMALLYEITRDPRTWSWPGSTAANVLGEFLRGEDPLTNRHANTNHR